MTELGPQILFDVFIWIGVIVNTLTLLRLERRISQIRKSETPAKPDVKNPDDTAIAFWESLKQKGKK